MRSIRRSATKSPQPKAKHADIGGVVPNEPEAQTTSDGSVDLGLFPLMWMVRQAEDAGLILNHSTLQEYFANHEDYEVKDMNAATLCGMLLSSELRSLKWDGVSATDDAPSFASMKYRNRLSRLLGAASLDKMAQLFPLSVIDVLGRSMESVMENRYRRKIHYLYYIHQSVIDRMIESGYRPRNLREYLEVSG